MGKKTVQDIEVAGKKVLVRVDFNVPKDKVTGEITDDTRIRAALPTISYLLEQDAKVILLSHLGRPKGEVVESLRLDAVAKKLEQLIGKSVVKVDETIGVQAKAAVDHMNNGDIVLLENVRFCPGETKNDPQLSQQLASLGDIYVNDAFGAAHRGHCSTEGVANYLPAVAGLLMKKEISVLGNALQRPQHPFVAIIGGAKVSDKIGVIQHLLEKVDTLIIGGGMANTFLQAQGFAMGKSLVETDKVDLATQLLQQAKDKGKQLLLPVDVVVADGIDQGHTAMEVSVDAIPQDKMALDIGSKTVAQYREVISQCKTILWNGPMGVFEVDAFAKGTNGVAQAVADSEANSIVGGGDSVAAIEKAGLADKISHISTGGGASLEFLEGKRLPGIQVLLDR